MFQWNYFQTMLWKEWEKKKTNGTKMVVTKEKDRLLLTSNLSIVCIPYSKILFLSNFSIFSLFIRKSKSVKMRDAYFHPSVSFFEEVQGDDLSEQWSIICLFIGFQEHLPYSVPARRSWELKVRRGYTQPRPHAGGSCWTYLCDPDEAVIASP